MASKSTTGNVQSTTPQAPFWEAREVPVFCNVLCDSRAEALAVPRGEIRLTFDERSGLIRNVAFDPDRMNYDVRYENALHHSPKFQAYASELIAHLVTKYDLRGRHVLEIACGQGDFLGALCRAGNNAGVGFDPAFTGVSAHLPPNVRVVQEYYSSSHADVPADFIACRHALEHVPDPVGFLRGIRRTIGGRRDAVVFFEVPNGLYTLRELGIWDLIYEHCTYFVAESLRWCFERAGFDVLDVSEAFGGQFITIEAKPGGEVSDDRSTAGKNLARVRQYVSEFAEAYRAKVGAWRARMTDWRAAGRRAVVWGSGSKGVTFLNVIQPATVIERVVDINPRKQGRYVAGTGQLIVPPEALRADAPDAVIVMNAIYLDEIEATLSELGVSAEVVTA